MASVASRRHPHRRGAESLPTRERLAGQGCRDCIRHIAGVHGRPASSTFHPAAACARPPDGCRRDRGGREVVSSGCLSAQGAAHDLPTRRRPLRPHGLQPLRPERPPAPRPSRSACGRTSAPTGRSTRAGRSCAARSTSASRTSISPTTTGRRTAPPRRPSGAWSSRTCAPHRDELVISTKAGYDMWPGPYGDLGSRKYLLASLDQSLQRMGLDYVDIFYSHRRDPGHAAGGDDRRAGHRGAAGQGAVCGHLVVLRRAHARGRRDPAGARARRS